MAWNVFTRWMRGSSGASMDADLVALVKAGAPTNSDRTTGQQRLCIDTTDNSLYYHDGGASTSWNRISHGDATRLIGESATLTASLTTAVDTGIDWPSSIDDNDVFLVVIDDTSAEYRSTSGILNGEVQKRWGNETVGSSFTSGDYFELNIESASSWLIGKTSTGDLLVAGNNSVLNDDDIIVSLYKLNGAAAAAALTDAQIGSKASKNFPTDLTAAQQKAVRDAIDAVTVETVATLPSAAAGTISVGDVYLLTADDSTVPSGTTLASLPSGQTGGKSGDVFKVTARTDAAITLTWQINTKSSAGGATLATNAEMVTGTSTTKAPTVKQVRDFGASASSLAVKWNGANNPVTAGIASLAPYSDASGGAATYYDSTNLRWQLLRATIEAGTGAKAGNLFFSDPYFNFTQMVMSFKIIAGRQTAGDTNAWTDMFWGAETDALNGAADSWVGTNTKGLYVRYKRAASVDKLLLSFGVNDSAIRTGLGSKTVGYQGRYYGPNVAGNFELTDLAAPHSSSAAEEAVAIDISSTDTSEHAITFNVLMNLLSFYVDGKLGGVLDMGFVPGIGNTYTFGPRYGVMGDDGSGVPDAMFSYLTGFTLGTPDPLNADPAVRPPQMLVNPTPAADTVATKMQWDGETFRFGTQWSDITNKPTDLAEIPVSSTTPASPTKGDLWVDDNGASPTLRLYDGSAWISVDASGPTADSSMPLISLFDHVHADEWYRYGANTTGAPTANPGVMVLVGDKAAALDLATGKAYRSSVSAAPGSWSAAVDATLTDTNFATATADTVVSIGSSSTGWPAAATAAGVDGAAGGKTVIGTTTWGICIVRNGVVCDAYTKNGSAAWALAGGLDDVVVTHWTQVPVGKLRILDLWAKQIAKRTTAAEAALVLHGQRRGLLLGERPLPDPDHAVPGRLAIKRARGCARRSAGRELHGGGDGCWRGQCGRCALGRSHPDADRLPEGRGRSLVGRRSPAASKNLVERPLHDGGSHLRRGRYVVLGLGEDHGGPDSQGLDPQHRVHDRNRIRVHGYGPQCHVGRLRRGTLAAVSVPVQQLEHRGRQPLRIGHGRCAEQPEAGPGVARRKRPHRGLRRGQCSVDHCQSPQDHERNVGIVHCSERRHLHRRHHHQWPVPG